MIFSLPYICFLFLCVLQWSRIVFDIACVLYQDKMHQIWGEKGYKYLRLDWESLRPDKIFWWISPHAYICLFIPYIFHAYICSGFLCLFNPFLCVLQSSRIVYCILHVSYIRKRCIIWRETKKQKIIKKISKLSIVNCQFIKSVRSWFFITLIKCLKGHRTQVSGVALCMSIVKWLPP